MTNEPTSAPEHTFIVMAYGDSPYLPACLDALARQTVRSALCIATSTPSDYLRAQAARIGAPLVETESGRGIAHDWNFALRLAKTKYVTLAHQDDLYAPAYTAQCLAAIRACPDALICFTDYTELVGETERDNSLLLLVKRGILYFFMPRRRLKSRFWKTKLLSVGCPIAAPSVLYQVDNLGDFQFSADFSVNMDWEAWSRLALANGHFIFVPQKLMQHRIHPDSATTLGIAALRRQEEDERMFRRFWPLVMAQVLMRFYALSYRSNG